MKRNTKGTSFLIIHCLIMTANPKDDNTSPAFSTKSEDPCISLPWYFKWKRDREGTMVIGGREMFLVVVSSW